MKCSPLWYVENYCISSRHWANHRHLSHHPQLIMASSPHNWETADGYTIGHRRPQPSRWLSWIRRMCSSRGSVDFQRLPELSESVGLRTFVLLRCPDLLPTSHYGLHTPSQLEYITRSSLDNIPSSNYRSNLVRHTTFLRSFCELFHDFSNNDDLFHGSLPPLPLAPRGCVCPGRQCRSCWGRQAWYLGSRGIVSACRNCLVRWAEAQRHLVSCISSQSLCFHSINTLLKLKGIPRVLLWTLPTRLGSSCWGSMAFRLRVSIFFPLEIMNSAVLISCIFQCIWHLDSICPTAVSRWRFLTSSFRTTTPLSVSTLPTHVIRQLSDQLHFSVWWF